MLELKPLSTLCFLRGRHKTNAECLQLTSTLMLVS